MKDKVFGILKHSALYSFGNIAQKGMGLVTLPINAYYLSKSEFGTLAILEIVMIIIAEVLTLGQANSVIYFNTVKEYAGKAKSIFFTITIMVLFSGIVFAGLSFVLNISFPNIFDEHSYFAGYLFIIAAIGITRAINSVFFNKLRAEEKSLQYTVLTMIRIVITICLIILMVVYLRLAVTGILYAYLISEISCLIIFVPLMISQMDFKFEKAIGRQALNYGMPLIFSALGIYILNLSDRFLIKSYYDLSAVGTYDFGYKIAGVLQMVLIMPFSSALLPSAYKQYKTPGDKRYYSKLMTYMCFVLIWGGLALSLFSDLVVSIMGQNKYLGAEIFVPIIILAYIFSSMRAVASTGILLSEKTIYIGVLTVAAGVLNVILNIIFLPIYGVITAAYTTLAAFILFFWATKIISDKYYHIPYEVIKLLKLFATAIILFLISSFMKIDNIYAAFALKIIMIIVFPLVMYVLNFYEAIELKTIKDSIGKLKSPADIKNILNNLLRK